jgi:hypothetical protein
MPPLAIPSAVTHKYAPTGASAIPVVPTTNVVAIAKSQVRLVHVRSDSQGTTKAAGNSNEVQDCEQASR